jgi:hypothetical protein
MDLENFDKQTRNLILMRANEIMSSVKIGDYVHLFDSVDERWDENMDNSIYSIEMKVVGGRGGLSMEDKRNLSMIPEGYKLKVPEVIKVYKVYDIVNGIPQLELVPPFPNMKAEKIDLMDHYCDSIEYSLCDVYMDNIQQELEFKMKVLDNFIVHDSNYMDSILLDSTYVPYQSGNAFLEFRQMIREKAYNSPRAVAGRKAAETRRANKLIDLEFQKLLDILSETDDDFYDEVRGV